jgi:uncharacterized protein YndB with AHSA1/START domain
MRNSETLKIAPSGEREVMMTRVFDAPRHLVFDALTTPELIKRWLLGPEGWTMVVCTVDLRVGGAYRYVLRRDKDGIEMGWGGVYREITRPDRLVHTERFDEAWYGSEALITTTLVEKQGHTTMTATILHESKEALDRMLASGMEKGVAMSYDRLEGVLADVRQDSRHSA